MVKRLCSICGKEFFVKEFHAKKGWGKFCSIACRSKGQVKGIWTECDYCGKKIYRTPRDFRKSQSKKFFCSVSCHCSWENENNRCGVNAPNWVAGESVYRRLLTREGIGPECRECGITDIRLLTVHHKDGSRKNNNVNNLEWLCRNCHCLVHWC
jgi:hypothetical protein